MALVGPSGCGKSTLLSILAGLREPDSGEVLVDGRPDPERLGRITLMPQSDALLPWRTLLDNVRLGARLGGLPARERDRAPGGPWPGWAWRDSRSTTPTRSRAACASGAALARTLLGGGRGVAAGRALRGARRPHAGRPAGRARRRVARDDPTVLLVTHDIEEAILLADRVLVSGPRPARVVDEVAVDLPRPRGLADTARPEFGELRGGVLDGLRSAGALA